MSEGPLILTIGHSTRTLDAFLELLRAHRVGQLVDIRTVPRSRRYPHFSREALAASLEEAGIAYRHAAALGGLRKPRRDSKNTGWRHEGFRGYADYMETAEFRAALDDLVAFASAGERRDSSTVRKTVANADTTTPAPRLTAIMCAEAVWWRCHRQLVADALVARGLEVRHIMSDAPPAPHALTEFARVTEGRVSYPGLL